MDIEIDKMIVSIASTMPEGKPPVLRTDEYKESFANVNERIKEATEAVEIQTFEYYTEGMSDALKRVSLSYIVEGKELPYSAESSLNYQARKLGLYDWRELLQYMALSYQK